MATAAVRLMEDTDLYPIGGVFERIFDSIQSVSVCIPRMAELIDLCHPEPPAA
jgi:hypothetical protein